MYVLSGAGECCQAGPPDQAPLSGFLHSQETLAPTLAQEKETLAPSPPGDGDSVTKLSLIIC